MPVAFNGIKQKRKSSTDYYTIYFCFKAKNSRWSFRSTVLQNNRWKIKFKITCTSPCHPILPSHLSKLRCLSKKKEILLKRRCSSNNFIKKSISKKLYQNNAFRMNQTVYKSSTCTAYLPKMRPTIKNIAVESKSLQERRQRAVCLQLWQSNRVWPWKYDDHSKYNKSIAMQLRCDQLLSDFSTFSETQLANFSIKALAKGGNYQFNVKTDNTFHGVAAHYDVTAKCWVTYWKWAPCQRVTTLSNVIVR